MPPPSTGSRPTCSSPRDLCEVCAVADGEIHRLARVLRSRASRPFAFRAHPSRYLERHPFGRPRTGPRGRGRRAGHGPAEPAPADSLEAAPVSATRHLPRVARPSLSRRALGAGAGRGGRRTGRGGHGGQPLHDQAVEGTAGTRAGPHRSHALRLRRGPCPARSSTHWMTPRRLSSSRAPRRGSSTATPTAPGQAHAWWMVPNGCMRPRRARKCLESSDGRRPPAGLDIGRPPPRPLALPIPIRTMTPESLTFLKALLDTPGPCAFEAAPARVWRAEAERFCERVTGRCDREFLRDGQPGWPSERDARGSHRRDRGHGHPHR